MIKVKLQKWYAFCYYSFLLEIINNFQLFIKEEVAPDLYN